MKIFKRLLIVIFSIAFISVSLSFFNLDLIDTNQINSNTSYSAPTIQEDLDSDIPVSASNSSVDIYFLNVGNADCEFIVYTSDTVSTTFLIDGGEQDSAIPVIDYINSLGYTSIDYYVGTHPHFDHIGAAQKLIENYNIENIFMPRIPDEYVPTTLFYKNLLLMCSSNNKNIVSPDVGDRLFFSDDFSVTFLNSSNNNTYAKADMNAYSLSLLFKYKDNNLAILSGDATIDNEREILSNWELNSISDVKIFKASHHCSNTSNSSEFISIISPSYVFIPVGVNNSYGHPHKNALNILQSSGATIYRADVDSTTLFHTVDGEIFDVSTNLTEVLK